MKQNRPLKIPKSLKYGSDEYLELLQINGLIDSDAEVIYDFYNMNVKNKLSYSMTDVRDELLNMCKCRCSICTHKLNEVPKDDYKSTIEHIKPQSLFPRLIFNWDNLIMCCNTCNGARRNKPYSELYINPCEEDLDTYFEVCLNGELRPADLRINAESSHMIQLYNLNKKNLVSSRFEFINSVLDPFFSQLFVDLVDGDDFILFKNIYDTYGGK